MDIEIKDLCKSYGDHVVLDHLSLTFPDHGIYCLMAPSGAGKTTFLRILAGLETADSGTVTGAIPGHISVQFQENRLIEFLDPVENTALVSRPHVTKKMLRRNLAEILPASCLSQPVDELSGGMQRRAALARAVWYPSSLILLDEPFTGLDCETRKSVIQYLLRMRRGRTMLLATHNKDDADLLGGEIIRI